MLDINLSPRLSAVASYIRSGSIAADIGTDHGQLICWLAQNAVIRKGYACDVNIYPLQRAEELILSTGLQNKVELMLTDGLTGLDKKTVSDFAIAGMGGELIAGIIDDAAWVKNPHYNLVLQPMSRDYRLRQYLLNNGFKIISETAIVDGKFTYSIMQVVFTGVRIEITRHYAWSGEIWYQSDSSSIGYLKNRLNQLEQMIPSFKGDTEYLEIIDEWRERLK